MPAGSANKGLQVLAATSTLAAVLGSVHAFSVFLTPLEQAFDASRAQVSLTYSLALATLTLAVLTGHRIYGRWRPGPFIITVALIAASGVVVAAFAPSLTIVWLGYGVLFGGANGLGYGFGLQLAAQANPGREGLAMGIVTAAYALGAAVSPPLFAAALDTGGYQPAMIGLCLALIALGGVSAALLTVSGVRFSEQPANMLPPLPKISDLTLLWIGYGAGVAGGLMAIGHAAGIIRSVSATSTDWTAPVVIALCNLIGSLIAGRLADRLPPVRLLIGLPLLSAAALALLALSGSVQSALIGLGCVGFAYGGIIAAYPSVIAKLYGLHSSPRIYGLVFTAWGTAGLVAPWFAGQLYDWNGSYQTAVMTGCALSVVSTVAVATLFLRR